MLDRFGGRYCPTVGLRQDLVDDFQCTGIFRSASVALTRSRRLAFVFLAVILDAWSRRVVGYAVSRQIDTRLTIAALKAALENRQPPPGCIHHTDRGSQYGSAAYRTLMGEWGLRGSMSRRGNPYDNAQCESFIKTVKYEEVYLNDYETFQDVVNRLPRFLDRVNRLKEPNFLQKRQRL